MSFRQEEELDPMQRLALALCPVRGREWLAAMFAELAVIGGVKERARWLLGMPRVIIASVLESASRELSLRLRVALTLSLLAAAVCLISGLAEVELVQEDDWLLVASGALAATFIVLTRSALRRIYTTPLS
jgi:hypothetical protein